MTEYEQNLYKNEIEKLKQQLKEKDEKIERHENEIDTLRDRIGYFIEKCKKYDNVKSKRISKIHEIIGNLEKEINSLESTKWNYAHIK